MKTSIYIYLSVLVFCTLHLKCNTRRVRRQNRGGYIFTSARSLKIGSNNELQLIREGNLDEGYLKVRLYYSENYNGNETLALQKEYNIEEGREKLFYKFFVPTLNASYVYNGRLEIEGRYGGKVLNGSDKVYLGTPKKNILIIQTDKPLYKPGQTVQFRVLKVNKVLKPSGEHDDVADVFIEDPKRTRLFQFKNVHLGKGIQQREFALANEPVLGSWQITVEGKGYTESTNFDVKEYELPKYDVKVKFPSYVLANAKEIQVEVCAKYTYGKNVEGILNLNASVETYSWSNDKQPVIQETFKLDGCYNYTINVSLIEPNSVYRYRRIMVVANVIETGTGVQRNATEYLQRQYSPLNIAFVDQSGGNYYKPGLPYQGKIKVTYPDDTPATGEDIEVCATVSRERVIANWFGTRKTKICKTYTSCSQGLIPFTIPPQNTDSVSMQLNAKSLKYAKDPKSKSPSEDMLNQPETSQSLSPYYSPSGNFIQLQSIGKPLACGEKQNIRLLFTSKEDAEFKFQYQIIRQSEVVKADDEVVCFTKDDDISAKLLESDDVLSGPEVQLVPQPRKGDSSSSSSSEDCPGAKESTYVPPIGAIDIPIHVDASLSPSITLLVFYTRSDREVIADSHKFEIEKCFKNKVGFKFGDEVKQPATKTSVTITASPNSLCGIKVVDKSVSLLDSSDQLSKNRVFELLSSLDSNVYYSPNPCYDNKPQPGLYSSKMIIRPPIYSSSSYQDSLVAFTDSGFLVISDLLLFTRPCSSSDDNSGGYGGGGYDDAVPESAAFAPAGPGIAMASTARRPAPVSADAKMGSAPTKSAVDVRDYFPETWLFQMEMTGPNGKHVSKKKLPHTITEWVGDAVCINSKDGLGLSETTTIKGFQAFFISYTLPVSVIRGEVFTVIVSIFNYADGALPIKVTLADFDGFELVGDPIDGEVCIEPSKSSNFPLKLKATKVGNNNITVAAETVSSSDGCESDISNAIAKDAIRKSLQVEAEGFPVEKVTSYLFCPTDEESQEFKKIQELSLPENIVPDSSRALVDTSGNVLGPALRNLNNLVSLPTGCGEQNMVKFTPNYLVLNYLTYIGQLTEKNQAIQSQAIRNLNTGYQRQLNYKRSDGSFSAFGEVDKEGSMFLTAFVLKSFYAAKKYITIDNNVLTQAQNWIASKQQGDGCFPNVGRIIDYGFQGGLEKKKNNGVITAYVLVSLLQSKYENETVINNALSCIAQVDGITISPYETFLCAYAEAIAEKKDEAEARLENIKPRSNSTGDVEYYRNINGSNAMDLETAAYAVLTNLELGNSASSALALVRYMTQNLNPRGGFFSTQDTCIGLEALSGYAKLVYADPVDILVKFSALNNVEITEDNKLLVQRQLIADTSQPLQIEATGSGCGLVQIYLRYNTVSPPESQLFKLDVSLNCYTDVCKKGEIIVNVRYLPDGKASGMTIVKIKLITGLVPEKESIDNLKNDLGNNRNQVQKVEIENNNVILYLYEVDNIGSKISFNVEELVDVENPQPGTAEVYDYYTPEHNTRARYTRNGCSQDDPTCNVTEDTTNQNNTDDL